MNNFVKIVLEMSASTLKTLESFGKEGPTVGGTWLHVGFKAKTMFVVEEAVARATLE